MIAACQCLPQADGVPISTRAFTLTGLPEDQSHLSGIRSRISM